MVAARGLTLEEYLGLPEDKPYREYVNGEVVPKLAPQRRHVALAEELIVLIRAYRGSARGAFSGPEPAVLFDVPGDRRVLLPDVAYWAPGKPQGGELMAAPTLAVEIRSPGQPRGEMREKGAYYVDHGVDAAWLVDPESRTVELFERDRRVVIGPGEALSSPLLPGLSIDVAALFAATDPSS